MLEWLPLRLPVVSRPWLRSMWRRRIGMNCDILYYMATALLGAKPEVAQAGFHGCGPLERDLGLNQYFTIESVITSMSLASK